MPKIKKFIEGEVEKEFDHIMSAFALMVVSATVMCGAIYAVAYTATPAGFLLGAIIFCIGAGFYLFVDGTGIDAIKGLLMWRKIIKAENLTKEQKLKRDRNVHLSLSIMLSIATSMFVAIIYVSSKQSLTGFNTSAFQDISTAVIIADSIFAAFMVAQLGGYRKRILAMYQLLIVGILFSIVSLISIGLGVAHFFVVFITTVALFCMYYLFSVFLYYNKLLLKMENLKPASQSKKANGPSEI